MPYIITLPEPFNDLLKNSEYEGAVKEYLSSVSKILVDNKTPFFPNYTDHGFEHIELILKNIVQRLIPSEVLKNFTDSDVIVLLCSVLLHDIAMHLRHEGFLELVNENCDHTPVDWFNKSEGIERQADVGWRETWSKFRADVKRFSENDFIEITGVSPDSVNLKHWLSSELPEDTNSWNQYDLFLIGEFIRRYHGRLAHEIALYGFPGLSHEEFPILSKTIPKLSNLAGLVARSHSLPLRTSIEYLEYEHRSDLRPRNTLATYHMALLRISDYLQLESERAPKILFRLRTPNNVKSIDEWNKHGSVAHISYLNDDPLAIKIELDKKHSLSTHIQMVDLIDGLQRELDISSAILSEVYGKTFEDFLNRIRLNKIRVHSNHKDLGLINSLPYIPLDAKFSADPKVLSLMISPMYGNFPEIGVRELVQNSIDAVVELKAALTNKLSIKGEVSFYEQNSDVLVKFYGVGKGRWFLRVTDKGIGMKPETVRDYFLKAGASFRDSNLWRSSFVDPEGKSSVTRTGRFGIGVFAAFLLGESIEVSTRNVDEARGISFSATMGSSLIEFRKKDLPVGTSLKIELSDEAAKWLEHNIEGHSWDWYCYEKPSLTREITIDGVTSELPQSLRLDNGKVNEERSIWSTFNTGMYQVSWGAKKHKALICNRVVIAGIEKQNSYNEESRKNKMVYAAFHWNDSNIFHKPAISVMDPEGGMPLTLRRDGLSEPLPFESELNQDMLLDCIAFLLSKAPYSPIWGDRNDCDSYRNSYPLLIRKNVRMNWLCTNDGVAPFDGMVLSRLKASRIVICGYLSDEYIRAEEWPEGSFDYPENVVALVVGGIKRKSKSNRSEYNRHRDHESEDDLSPMEVARLDLIAFAGQIRESMDFDVLGARFFAGSPEGTMQDFSVGQSFNSISNLKELIQPREEVSLINYDWDTGEKTIPKRRDIFAAELMIKPFEKNTSFGSSWFEIVEEGLIPFDKDRREKIYRFIDDKFGLQKRIDKWK